MNRSCLVLALAASALPTFAQPAAVSSPVTATSRPEDGIPLDLRGPLAAPGARSVPRTPEEWDPDVTAGVAVVEWLARLRYGADGGFMWQGGDMGRILAGVRLSVVAPEAEARLDLGTDGSELSKVGYRIGFDKLIGKRVPLLIQWDGDRQTRPDGSVVHRTDGQVMTGLRLDGRHEALFHMTILDEPAAGISIDRFRAVLQRASTSVSGDAQTDPRNGSGSAETYSVFVGVERGTLTDGVGQTRVVAGTGQNLRLVAGGLGFLQVRARVEVAAGVRDI